MHRRYLVLNYHALSDNIPATGGDFVVQPQNFKAQLDLIMQLRLPISMAGSRESSMHLETGIAITFDDGNESDYTIAAPELKDRAMSATFFPVINTIGESGKLDKKQIRSLRDDGFGIGSHGLTHRNLVSLDANHQLEELTKSRTELAEITGDEVKAFAFPYGSYSRALLNYTMEAGYSCAMTTEVMLNDPADNNFLVHRWNVRRTTTLEEFRQMISGCGELGWGVRTKTYLKHYVRKAINPHRVEEFRNFIKPASNG